MVELHGRRILENVAPPDVGLVCALGVGRVEKFICRRSKATTHKRELVVEKTSVEARNEGAYECLSACSPIYRYEFTYRKVR